MTTVKVKNVISQKMRVTNESDEQRAYTIEADVTRNSNGVGSIESGSVVDKDNGINVATFYNYNGSNCGFNFVNNTDFATQLAAVSVIQEFMTACEDVGRLEEESSSSETTSNE